MVERLVAALTDGVLSPTALLSWNVDLTVCDLDKELQVFKAKHTAEFSAQVKGQSSRHTQTFHVVVFLLRRCRGGSSAERRQGFCASADRFTASVRDLSDLRAFGPQPKYGQGSCRRADLCHEGLDEQPVTGTFPLTQLVFFFISV